MEALEKSSEFKSSPRPVDAPPASGAGLLAALLGGLKHWEQGLPEVAEGYFAAVLANGAQAADAWISPYQQIVRNYQADARKLAALDPGKLPGSAAACRDLAKQLADAAKKVRGLDVSAHARDFFDAVRSRKATAANADIMRSSHNVCHAAAISWILKRTLTWDAAKHEFVNDAEANSMRSRTSREWAST